MAISGQLWYASEGVTASSTSYDTVNGDNRIGHLNSDGSNVAVTTSNPTEDTGYNYYYDVALDTADNLYFALTFGTGQNGVGSLDTYLVVGNIATGAVLGRYQVGDGAENTSNAYPDEVNSSLAIDYVSHKIYFNVYGSDAATTGIFEATYNANAASTGTVGFVSGYDPVNDAVANSSLVLLSETNVPSYINGSAFDLDMAASKLYYVDDSFNFNAYTSTGVTNGIYVVSTASQNATPTLIASLPPTFTASDGTQHFVQVESLVVDQAKQLIYFVTNESDASGGVYPDTANDALYYVSINGGTPTKMTLPTGITIDYPEGNIGTISYTALALDPNSQTLYVSDRGNDYMAGHTSSGDPRIISLVLNADGTGFAASGSNNSFYVVDPDSNYGVADGIVFAALPTLTVSNATSQAVQGSASYTAAGSSIALADPDSNIASATVKIANSSDAAVSGDELYVSSSGTNAQSGSITVGGATFAVAFNTTTNTLTLTGDATPAQYAAALADVTYRDSGTDTTTTGHAVRTLTWTVNDGEAGNPTDPTYNLKTTTLTLDRAPAAATHTGTVVETGSLSSVALGDTDPDGDTVTATALSGGTVGTAKAGTYGTLTLNSNDTYSYTANNTASINAATAGAHPVDSFTYTASDGVGGTATETLNITIDRPPAVTLGATTLAYTPGGPAAQVAATGTVTDADSDNVAALTVHVTGGYSGDGDEFRVGSASAAVLGASGTATVGVSFSYTYDAATETLSFTGAHTAAQYQTLLQALYFDSSAADPTNAGAYPSRTLSVSATDSLSATGATASETASLAPAAPTIATLVNHTGTGGAGVTDHGDVELSGTAPANSTVTLYNGATAIGSGTATSGGTFDITATTPLNDGSYTLSAKASVGASVSAASAGFGVTVDTVAPTVAVTAQTLAHDTGASSNDGVTNNGQVTLTGTSSDASPSTGLAGVEIYNGATDLGAATVSGGGWTFSTTLGQGTYNLQAKATDAAGNVATTTAQSTLVVDTTAPTLGAATTTAAGGIHAGATVTFTVPASEAVVVSGTPELTLSNGGVASYASGSGTNTLTFSYVVAGGQYTTDLHVTGLALNGGAIGDAAGNAQASGVANTDTGLSVDSTPPSLSLTAASTAAVQGGAASAVLASDIITDTDGGGTLTGATIAVANAVTGDILTLPGISGATGTLDGGAISVSGNGSASLTISGADALSEYQTVLAEVLYQDTGTDTTTSGHASRSFDFTVSNANLTSGAASSVLEIDRAPVVPGQAISVVAGATGSADASAGLLGNATDADGDTLSIVAVNGSSAAVGQAATGADGTVTINADGSYSFVASASINAAMGSHPSVVVPFTVSDGHGATVDADLTVTLDRPPTTVTATALVSAAAGLSTTAATGVVSLDADADGDTITVSAITGGTVGQPLAGTYGDLTLNGDGSYTYTPGSTASEASALAGYSGGRPVDSFSLTISDSDGGATPQTLAITIDRPPVAAAGAAPATYTEGETASLVLPTATATDADGDSLTSATLSISAGLLASDVLAATVTGTNIAASYDATTGVLTLSGTDTAADYQQVLDSVTFATPAETAADYVAGAASRTLSVQLIDGSFSDVAVDQTIHLGVVFADTAANVAANFDSLNGDPNLVSITVTDGQALAITAAQFTNDTSTLAKIAGAHEVVATGFTNGDYTSIDDVFDAGGHLIDATFSGVMGQAYTAYTQVFDTSGHLTSETFTGYTGQPYVSMAEAFDSDGRVVTQTYFDASGDPAPSQPDTNITYSNDGSYTSTVTLYDSQGNPSQTIVDQENANGSSSVTYSGVMGQGYTGYSQSYDASHALTSETLSGYDVSTYGYASVIDTFNSSSQVTAQIYEDGSGNTVQTVSTSYGSGGAFTETTTDYDSQGNVSLTIVDAQNADGSGVVNYGHVTGQPFTGYSQTFDASDHLTAETLSGYDMSTYGFASVTDSFNGSGQVTAQSYENASSGVVQTVALSYGAGSAYSLTTNLYDGQGGLTETIVDTENGDGSGTVTYSNISGQPYTGYSQTYDTTNTLVNEQVFNTGGSETDYAFGQNQAIASHPADQVEYAIGGNDIFVISPNFGHDQINNYTGGNDSFDISSSLFPDFASLMAAAADDGHGDTLITYDADDTFLIAGLTPAQLQAHASDFHFV